MDDLSALPYLDTVVRETLRVHSPVPSTIRVAMEDDVIPLNSPFVDNNGQIHHGIKYATPPKYFFFVIIHDVDLLQPELVKGIVFSSLFLR